MEGVYYVKYKFNILGGAFIRSRGVYSFDLRVCVYVRSQF